VGDDAVLILSEPLVDLPGAWAEIPEATFMQARQGTVDYYPFIPTYSEP
jgi:glutamine amidotransferase